MKVSIIIPTRNRTHNLAKLLKDIEKQTEKPDEIIIVVYYKDNETKEFLNRLITNLPVKYVKTDGGSCKSRNRGIKEASGDIIIFLDDDNILEKNYIMNTKKIFKNNNINVIGGYTFDIVDLTTPWFIKRGEFKHICNNKDDKFFMTIIMEISKKYPDYCNELNKKHKILAYSLTRFLRNFFKILILQEWPKKGIILPSGYRSEMPDIKNLKGLKKVEWIGSGNFAVRKKVINKFQFNEDLELLHYALAEDLELSARMGKDYEIFISPDLKLFHLRSIDGIKINQRQRFKSIVVNFYIISSLRGNKFAYWWSIIGIIISRIFTLPFSYKNGISELKGIIDGIKYLENLN